MGAQMNDLIDQIERLRLEMLLGQPQLIENLQRLEAHLLHERDNTVGHIRHIKALRNESEAIIRGELEALRAALVPTQANTPPPIPDLEERFAAPRYLRAAE
jgi:hypothetical protein